MSTVLRCGLKLQLASALFLDRDLSIGIVLRGWDRWGVVIWQKLLIIYSKGEAWGRINNLKTSAMCCSPWSLSTQPFDT